MHSRPSTAATAAPPRRCAHCCRKAALIRERVRIEALWLLHLAAAVPQLPGATLGPAVRGPCRAIAPAPDEGAAAAVKAIEARINHDVKAVEYYVREQLTAAGAAPATLELVHFGCTSEDINNLSYARLLATARQQLLATLESRTSELTELAHRYADAAMLSRTHGQAASPTTLGKELANFVVRGCARARQRWSAVASSASGTARSATSTRSQAALPEVDWPSVARSFVESLGARVQPPHDPDRAA